MPITTDLDKFRLELGDTDPDAPLLNDDEAQHFLDGRPASILLAVADACDALARKYAREYDFKANGDREFKRSQKSAMFRAQAKELRDRANLEAGGGLSVLTTTRIDGYSEDLNTREGAGSDRTNGRVRHGYYDDDLPPS